MSFTFLYGERRRRVEELVIFRPATLKVGCFPFKYSGRCLLMPNEGLDGTLPKGTLELTRILTNEVRKSAPANTQR
jgi:hypothetical protein